MPNGQLPNGVMPTTLSGGPGTMQAGTQGPTSFPIPAPGPQSNGILAASGLSSAGVSSQPPNFPQMPGQRPPGPQQRGSNGMPFQSPTLSHAPNPSGQQHQQAPMGQLGPSQHIPMNRSGMLPPNGPQGMNNPGVMGSMQQGQTSASFQQRPPSRTASPSNMMSHTSPSLMARQVGMPSGPNPMLVNLENEFRQIPTPILTPLKQELGLVDKDVPSLTHDDKVNCHATSLTTRFYRAVL
jgi:hypothetical protein